MIEWLSESSAMTDVVNMPIGERLLADAEAVELPAGLKAFEERLARWQADVMFRCFTLIRVDGREEADALNTAMTDTSGKIARRIHERMIGAGLRPKKSMKELHEQFIGEGRALLRRAKAFRDAGKHGEADAAMDDFYRHSGGGAFPVNDD